MTQPDTATLTLPLLPLREGVVLPGMVVTMAAGDGETRHAVTAARSAGGRILLVPQVDGRYARVGALAEVEDAGEFPGGTRAIVVRGLQRAIVGAGVPGPDEALWVRAEPVPEGEPTERARELAGEYRAVIENILELRGARTVIDAIRGISHPGAIADLSGYSPDLTFEQKVAVLEATDVERRLELVLGWARETLGQLTLKERIRRDVAEGMEKTQREFLLRQQLAAIRKELGEGGDGEDAIEEYRRKLAESGMPEPAHAAVAREIDRLASMSEQNPEHGWVRTWLDTILGMPWSVRTDDRLEVSDARSILDADHHGLSDVKDRILEYLAVRKLRAERGVAPATGRGSGAIIALVGPPGVGKTSLGESVARALGRTFVRVSLGGIRDEAEIRGHRRTYVGAMPGRIVRGLKEAGSMNPVFVLDEVDKLGADWRGDPSSALLEVLDPAQNHTFRDHYLEVDLDLSDVLFIATANVVDSIPGPLLDRMEIIHLDGYTEDEKLAIGRGYLLPRQLERNALRPDEVSIGDGAIRRIATDSPREAGVRSLARENGRLLRKIAMKLASDGGGAVEVGAEDVPSYLGKPRFYQESADRTAVPGVATGLAVTGTGGDVLFIEATSMAGEPGLTVTGQLGDVMRESAEIALSYVRAHATELGLAEETFAGRRFHLHVPAGAVPKDGPSAGITMVTALASLATGRPVRALLGMTGEVTLRGRVLPIGGVKQKVLAAHRAGLREVLLPRRNEPDLDDLPASVRAEIVFHPVEDVSEVLRLALEPAARSEAA